MKNFASKNLATILALAIASFVCPQSPALAIEISEVRLVNIASDGTVSNDEARDTHISADGNFVAFMSSADNLVAGDSNGMMDTFVHNVDTGSTIRVSTAFDGSEANGDSGPQSLSTDGNYVLFKSGATNIVADDTNGLDDLFVRDIAAGVTTRVNVATDGSESIDPDPANSIYRSNITGDGRYIVFSSAATNLVSDDTNNETDVFVHDLTNSETSRISVSSTGVQSNLASHAPYISLNGQYVVFTSFASNLVADDTNNRSDVFVKNLSDGSVTVVSVAPDGSPQNGTHDQLAEEWPSISEDNQFVVFASTASNLVVDDSEGNTDIFRASLLDKSITRISESSDGIGGNADSGFALISGDGRFVLYQTWSSSIVPPTDSGGVISQFLLHDTSDNSTIRVSGDTGAGQANPGGKDISADGLRVVLTSITRNLISTAPQQVNAFLIMIAESTGTGDGDTGGGDTGGGGGSPPPSGGGGGAISWLFAFFALLTSAHARRRRV